MLAIDHLVIAARDPEQAAKEFSTNQQVKGIQGGKHENWGTYNYLAYLANYCYIEWIGIFDHDRAEKSTNPLIRQLVHTLEQGHEGLFQLAFRTNDMNRFIRHFEADTIPFQGPFPGSREKPDGTTLAWKMLFPRPNEHRQLYPFIIEWSGGMNQADNERDISEVSLTSITVPHNMNEQWAGIYQLQSKDHTIQLANSVIHFTETEHVQFILDQS